MLLTRTQLAGPVELLIARLARPAIHRLPKT